MHQKIRRSTCAAVCKWWEQNGAPRAMNQPQPPKVNPGGLFFGVNKPTANQTKKVFQPGDPVICVSLYPPTISYDVAIRRVLKNKLKLQVRPLLDNELPSLEPVVALTGAAPNHIVQLSCPTPVFFAHVYTPFSYNEDTDPAHQHPYADELHYLKTDFTATDDESAGFARIYLYSGHGPSDAGGFWAVCLCEVMKGAGSGGGGQQLATTSTPVVSGFTVSNNAITYNTTNVIDSAVLT